MPVHIFNPSADGEFPCEMDVSEGGFGGTTPEENLQGIGGVPRVAIGQPDGPVPLNEARQIENQYLDNLKIGTISIVGPTSGRCGLTLVYQITNYSSFETYKVEYNGGSGYLEDNHIFYTLPDVAGPCGFSVEGRSIVVTAYEGLIQKPSIISPADNYQPISNVIKVRGSDFIIVDNGPYIETFVSADCEVATDLGFESIYASMYGVTGIVFNFTETYPNAVSYIRIRYRSNERLSEWSDPITIQPFTSGIAPPVFITPTEGSQTGTPDAADPLKATVTLNVAMGDFTPINMTDTFVSTDLEIATDSTFTQIVKSSYGNTSAEKNYTASGLAYNTLYYIRGRHRGAKKESPWSDPVQFRTVQDIRGIVKPTFVSGAPDPSKSTLTYVFDFGQFTPVNYADSFHQAEYQVALSPSFASLVTSGNSTERLFAVTGLSYATQYYVRARYKSLTKNSPWSDGQPFMSTVDDRQVVRPSIVSPLNNAVDVSVTPDVNSSVFATASNVVNYTDTHQSSDWELSTVSNFSTLTASLYGSVSAKNSWQPGTISYGTGYYARTRQRGISKVSDWSPAVFFTTIIASIATPTLSITGGVNNTPVSPVINGSAFTPVNYQDTHVSTDWQIATDAAFTTLVASSTGNTVNKTTWSPAQPLTAGTSYYARARYNGTGIKSQWSTGLAFNTAQVTVSPYYYAHDAGVLSTSPSGQYFRVKKEGAKLYYELSQTATWIEWTGATTPWSTMTYGTMWRNEGEAIRIASMSWINATTLRVTVEFYDASIGVRWSSYVDIIFPA